MNDNKDKNRLHLLQQIVVTNKIDLLLGQKGIKKISMDAYKIIGTNPKEWSLILQNKKQPTIDQAYKFSVLFDISIVKIINVKSPKGLNI